jgi:tRNA (guanine-N7-)-methyltransferase
MMRELFLHDIQRTLLPGGRLHFWTDVEEYFLVTLELLKTATSLIGPLEVPEQAAEHAMDFHTHFERRMRLHGEPVYRSEFLKPLPNNAQGGSHRRVGPDRGASAATPS